MPGAGSIPFKSRLARSRRMDRPSWPAQANARAPLPQMDQDRQNEQDQGLLLDRLEPLLPACQFPGKERNLIFDAVECLERLADLAIPA